MPSTDLTTAPPTEDAAHRHGGEAPSMEIWGLCPKCRNWFTCETWFDRSVPTPTCPTCSLLPGALRYERPDVPRGTGRRVVSELWLG